MPEIVYEPCLCRFSSNRGTTGALAALVGVSGGSRIVGIISHVAELKDRIDRQIIVTKDRSGGSRVQVQA